MRKKKLKVFYLALPSRSLPYQKVVQGERNGKRKNNVFAFTLPNRSLPYQKVVQGERNGKRKTTFLLLLCRTAACIA